MEAFLVAFAIFSVALAYGIGYIIGKETAYKQINEQFKNIKKWKKN